METFVAKIIVIAQNFQNCNDCAKHYMSHEDANGSLGQRNLSSY